MNEEIKVRVKVTLLEILIGGFVFGIGYEFGRIILLKVLVQ